MADAMYLYGGATTTSAKKTPAATQDRELSPEDSNGGKMISRRQVKKLLDKNPLELHLPNCNLVEWDDLMPLAPKMVDLLKIDLSFNRLISIDFLN